MALEEPGQRALAGGQLLAAEEEVTERRSGPGRARSSPRGRPSCPSRRGRPPSRPRPGRGSCPARARCRSGPRGRPGPGSRGRCRGRRPAPAASTRARARRSRPPPGSGTRCSRARALWPRGIPRHNHCVTNTPPPTELERGLVLAVLAPGADDDAELAEVEELVRAAGVEPVGSVVQHRAATGARHVRRQGKDRGVEAGVRAARRRVADRRRRARAGAAAVSRGRPPGAGRSTGRS